MRKKIMIMLLNAVMLTGMMMGPVGCGKHEETISQTVDDNDSVDIGLSIDSLVIERWQRERDLFVNKATELGANVNVQNANGDVEEQIRQIEYFIDKKMDVIVIISIDDMALTDVVARAKKAGIKIIAYDRLIRDADVDLYISMDNERVGELMGEYIRKAIGNTGHIIQIKGSPTDNNVAMVQTGFERVIDKTNISIDYVADADNWLAETAFTETSRYLSFGNIPDAIMCGNDNLAAYAIRALIENRLGGEVCVVGQDADLEACQRIVEGTQYMTVYKPVENLAKMSASIAVDMANGIAPDTDDTIDDGTYTVPYMKLDPIAVTRENMDEVITGKYHSRSEIYLNVAE